MALKTGEQYKESIRAMKSNVYKYGKLIEDLTTAPETAAHINTVAHAYDMSFDETKKSIYTATGESGEVAHRWNTLNRTALDQKANADMKRDQYRWSGCCVGATCAGWTALNVLHAVTFDMDKALGTDYHERLKKYMAYVEDNALALAGCITDAKGNRALSPSTQKNKDSNVHVVETREDGIVVRGYKIQIVGVSASNELIVVPGGGYKEDAKEFCMAFAVPRDADGITIVETRRPSDERAEQEGWDAPQGYGATQSYVLFDNVFIPNDRVFMNGEFKFSGAIIGNFAAIYRSAIGACTAGQGDIMIGAAMNMARANGLSHKPFQDKLTQMAITNEITYGLGLGAMLAGSQHAAGLWVPDGLLAHTNKTQVASLPYSVKVMAQDISGGIAETGCIPPYQDFQNPVYGATLLKTMEAGTDGESRIRAARLVEWLTVGGGIPGCMHGGGSPDGAKMVVKAFTKWENHAADAKRIAGITGVIEEPAKK